MSTLVIRGNIRNDPIDFSNRLLKFFAAGDVSGGIDLLKMSSSNFIRFISADMHFFVFRRVDKLRFGDFFFIFDNFSGGFFSDNYRSLLKLVTQKEIDAVNNMWVDKMRGFHQMDSHPCFYEYVDVLIDNGFSVNIDKKMIYKRIFNYNFGLREKDIAFFKKNLNEPIVYLVVHFDMKKLCERIKKFSGDDLFVIAGLDYKQKLELIKVFPRIIFPNDVPVDKECAVICL